MFVSASLTIELREAKGAVLLCLAAFCVLPNLVAKAVSCCDNERKGGIKHFAAKK